MATTVVWKPLFKDQAALPFSCVIHDLASHLLMHQPQCLTLDKGMSGLSLFFAYYARYLGDSPTCTHTPVLQSEQAFLKSQKLMTQAIDEFADADLGLDLYAGYTGIAFVSAHFYSATCFLNQEQEDLNHDFDESLFECLSDPWTGHYDLIIGLVGFGLYALERLPALWAHRCLTRIIEQIKELACWQGPLVMWRTPVSHLSLFKQDFAPHGLYDLGLAHGISGIISLLSGALHHGFDVQDLLAAAVAYLCEQEITLDGDRFFPHYTIINPLKKIQLTPKQGWCYGDLGVAASLLLAGQSLNRADIVTRSIAVACRVAQRGLSAQSNILDASLCHGDAGIAHVLNRMYQTTADESLAEYARLFFIKTLKRYQPQDSNLLGYQSVDDILDDGTITLDAKDYSFLTGIVGISLSLMAAITAQEPKWDHLLGISWPR